MRRLIPHPMVSATVGLLWILLVNVVTLNAIVFATILGIVVPLLTRAYWPDAPRIRHPLKITRYVLIVMWDIVVANIEVALIILFKRNRDLKSTFVTVPLDLTTPEAITVFAGTITMTPGTVSVDTSACGRALMIHCLNAPDPDATRAQVKARYEAPLKEIFE